VTAQKSRLKQLAATSRKLQRDGIILESPSLNDRLEAVKIQSDTLSKRSSDQLGNLEQVRKLHLSALSAQLSQNKSTLYFIKFISATFNLIYEIRLGLHRGIHASSQHNVCDIRKKFPSVT